MKKSKTLFETERVEHSKTDLRNEIVDRCVKTNKFAHRRGERGS